MLSKIIEFFKNLFSGFGGSKNKPQPNQPAPLPIEEQEFPQDASEIEADTATSVVIVSEEVPVIITPEEEEQEMETAITPDTGTPNDFSIEGEELEVPPIIEQPEIEVVVPEIEIPAVEEPVIPEPEIEDPKHKARYLWCLDNGHGKKTAGKRSPVLSNGKRLFEYEFNRDIVKRIITALKENGIQYFNVVPEVDIDNFLEGRVGRANSKKSNLPKIFISVHSNAFGREGWATPSGIETWYFHGSKSGQQIARVFQKHLVDNLGWMNRRLKSYPGKKQFYVLRQTSMPAVLTENGFYTNEEECKLLMQGSTRQKIADAHVAAILEIEKFGLSGIA